MLFHGPNFLISFSSLYLALVCMVVLYTCNTSIYLALVCMVVLYTCNTSINPSNFHLKVPLIVTELKKHFWNLPWNPLPLILGTLLWKKNKKIYLINLNKSKVNFLNRIKTKMGHKPVLNWFPKCPSQWNIRFKCLK